MVQTRQFAEALAKSGAEVEVLPKDVLRRRCAQYFTTAPPQRSSQECLQCSLAHRIQEQTLGGLTSRARNRLAKLVGVFERDPSFAPIPAQTFKPGKRLIREWKWQIHRVKVFE